MVLRVPLKSGEQLAVSSRLIEEINQTLITFEPDIAGPMEGSQDRVLWKVQFPLPFLTPELLLLGNRRRPRR